jgi:hypothetical protein
MSKRWIAKIITEKQIGEFCEWLNNWADFDLHRECLDSYYVINGKPNHISKYGEGYNQGISDVCKKLGLKYE